MTVHARHPSPTERDSFLVDGCPRCAEYVRDLGLQFTEARFREFWAKMLAVEYRDEGDYRSELDKELGRNLYRVSLALERAFGLDPRSLSLERFRVFTTLERDELAARLSETRSLGDNGVAARLREELDGQR